MTLISATSKSKVAYFNQQPVEIILNIFGYISHEEILKTIFVVCKYWKDIGNSEVLWKNFRPTNAFGKKEYQTHFNADIGEEPPLPRRIGYKYGDDHIPVVIPQTINGSPTNLGHILKLFKPPTPRIRHLAWEPSLKTLTESPQRTIEECVVKTFTKNVNVSYWVIMRRTTYPDSENKRFSFQERKKTASNYPNNFIWDIPNILETIICTAAGSKIYPNEIQHSTCCREQIDGAPVFFF